MLFNFCQVISSSPEIISPGLILHIHLTIFVPLLSSLITSLSLTGQVLSLCNITQFTYAEYNLLFPPKMKHLLANRGTKSLNLFHLLMVFVIALSTISLLASIDTKIRKLFYIFKRFCLISFVPFADLHLSDIWTWSSFWITSYTLSARNTRHFAFFCNVCSIFTTDHHFCLNMCSQLFWLQCSFSRFQSRFQALKCFTN